MVYVLASILPYEIRLFSIFLRSIYIPINWDIPSKRSTIPFERSENVGYSKSITHDSDVCWLVILFNTLCMARNPLPFNIILPNSMERIPHLHFPKRILRRRNSLHNGPYLSILAGGRTSS